MGFTHAFGARRLCAATAALVVATTTVLATPGLAGAAPPPTATAITITKVLTPSITVPDTPGAGATYVVKDIPATVSLVTDAPLNAHKSTRVLLTVTSGPDAASTAPIGFDVPAGATQAEIPGLTLATAANDVGIKVAVDERRSTVTPGTRSFDVFKNSLTAPSTSTLTGFGGGGAAGVTCSPTVEDAVCGDLLLPESNGVLSNQVLSQGACGVGVCPATASVLQALVKVDPAVYNNANPIELVAKCDKSLCGQGGVKSYDVTVQIRPGDVPATSPACARKGVIDEGLEFCTDYVQSTRDNAGDLQLVVLLAIDAKIIFK